MTKHPRHKYCRNRVYSFTRRNQMTDLTTLGRSGVVYADPPWSYRDLGHTRRIDKQYVILSVRDIAALPVPNITLPDAVLFLWVTAPLLPDGLTVMDAWGFKYKSGAVWDKEIYGCGHYFRIQHEHLLIGTKGRPGIASVHNISSVVRSRRGKHSVKPTEVYVAIERMYPTLPKIELFARNNRPGWTSWGDDPALTVKETTTWH
jgi:N6-adenosine-specific RNA methylase IME4